jgi:hypothetical protein
MNHSPRDGCLKGRLGGTESRESGCLRHRQHPSVEWPHEHKEVYAWPLSSQQQPDPAPVELRFFQPPLTHPAPARAAAAMESLPAGGRGMVCGEKRMAPNAFYDR